MPEDTVFNPTDQGTLRPNKPTIQKAGARFIPIYIEERPTYITLPKAVSPLDPYSLFELYYTPKIINSIIEVTNAYNRSSSKSLFAREKK